MNLLETVDLQRAIRSTAYKKAAQLYSEKNRTRGWDTKPTVNQVRGVFRIAYNQLYKAHPRTKWLSFEDKPEWISKLDYVAARGGKSLMQELLDIISKIGGQYTMVNPTKLIKYPTVIAPEPPLEDEDIDAQNLQLIEQAVDKAINFLGGKDE